MTADLDWITGQAFSHGEAREEGHREHSATRGIVRAVPTDQVTLSSVQAAPVQIDLVCTVPIDDDLVRAESVEVVSCPLESHQNKVD